jgi:glycosyltransferase involved in cell wall biosynthesis
VRYQIIEDSRKTKRVYVWYNLPRLNQIRVSEDKEYLRHKLGLEPNSFIICYLGRVPSWGIGPLKEILLDFGENFRQDEKVLFLIIGGGRWEEYYCKLIKNLRLTDRIIITGMRSRQNALEYLMASNVSCIPFSSSLASSHIVPTKLFEAMAMGVPVLCARSDNYVRILGRDGIYFDGSLGDFANKIRWCLTNQTKLFRISSNLKSIFQLEYTWEKRSFVLDNELRMLLEPPVNRHARRDVEYS